MRFLLLMLLLLGNGSASHATGIHEAAKAGDLAQIAAALEAGAGVDEIEKGSTPLLVAVRAGHLEAAKLLIESGADVDADPTPLLGPALVPALTKGRIDLTNLLLGAGANPNWRGNREAAIHIAVRSGCFDCVKALVEAGADVNVKTKDGKTPLHLASFRGERELAGYLVTHGAVIPTPPPISMNLSAADVEKGRAVFDSQCDGCHSVDPAGGTKTGPNLWNIVGRDKASVENIDYSDALLGWEGVWTYEDLNILLFEPMLTRPGVYMEMPGVPGAMERTDLIAYLRMLSDVPAPLP
jgi:cytochrome c